MKEWKNICEAYRNLREKGECSVLASLVDRDGTSFRMPGAKMLIESDGKTVASLGACLEKDLVEHSREVFDIGLPKMISYDLTSPQEIIWGLGLGCRGKMKILLERLPQKDKEDPILFMEECLSKGVDGLMAVVIDPGDGAKPSTSAIL